MPRPLTSVSCASAVLAKAVLVFFLLPASACTDGPEPAGDPTPGIDALVANAWVSADTITTIDPLTGEESVRAYTTDLSPDTLANGRVVFRVAEYMPVLESCAGGEDPVFCTQETLGAFTRASVRYPREALVRGIGGTSVATFVISPRGRVTETGIERSLGDVFDQEVLRVVGTLPPWRPGFHDGEPVAVRYKLPVTFAPPEG